MASEKMPKILVIGGGIAGISAAKQLLAGGLTDVTILEAENRLGGRIHTVDFGGKHLEMGAQWIHGEENNPIYNLAAKNHLLASNQTSDQSSLNSFDEYWETQFYTQDGKTVDPLIVKETCEVLEEIFDKADMFCRENSISADKDESMGTYLFNAFYKYLRTSGCDDADLWRTKEAIFHWRLQMEKTESACKSVYEMSAQAWGEFRECKGEEEITLRVGYSSLLDLLLCEIPSYSVRVNTPVQCIYWDVDNGCPPPHHPLTALTTPDPTTPTSGYPLAVRTKSGEVLPADHVIITASLGVLKKNAHFLFKPILPRDKMSAIHRLGFGTVDKIYLEWESPWWDRDIHAIQLAWMPDEPFSLENQDNDAIGTGQEEWYRGLHGFELVDYQPNLLCGWIAGAEAERMETVPDTTVLNVCHQLLQKFTGNYNIPKPRRIKRSIWCHEPYVGGSYSYIRMSSSGQDMNVLAQPLPSVESPRVLFAGEATHSQYFSTVHGAMLSGQREAQRLLHMYGRGDVGEGM